MRLRMCVGLILAASISVAVSAQERVICVSGCAGSGTQGAGTVDSTTTRVTIATDDAAITSLQLLDNAISGAGFNITQMNGVNVSMGAGVTGTGVQRVDLASDGAVATSLDNMEADLDTLVSNQGVDMTHGNAVAATGPGILCESKTIDGSALPNAVTEGQAARVACSIYGVPYATLIHADGLSGPIANEDVASAAAEAGIKVFAVRDDTLDARSGTEGDWEMLHLNANGALWAIDVNSAAALTSTQLIDDAVFTDDAAFTPATSKGFAVGFQADETSTDSIDEGDFGVPRMTLDRRIYTATADPCGGVKTYYVVDTADGTNLEIANSVASQFFYICSVNLVAAGATTVLISQDDTDGCGSPEAGLNGGSTGTTAEGQAFAANGGIALGNGQGTVMKTSTAARYLCLDQSGSVQLSGTIAYVSAP